MVSDLIYFIARGKHLKKPFESCHVTNKHEMSKPATISGRKEYPTGSSWYLRVFSSGELSYLYKRLFRLELSLFCKEVFHLYIVHIKGYIYRSFLKVIFLTHPIYGFNTLKNKQIGVFKLIKDGTVTIFFLYMVYVNRD